MVGVGMFVSVVVVSVSVVVVSVVSAPLGGSPRGVVRPTWLGRLAGPASMLASVHADANHPTCPRAQG